MKPDARMLVQLVSHTDGTRSQPFPCVQKELKDRLRVICNDAQMNPANYHGRDVVKDYVLIIADDLREDDWNISQFPMFTVEALLETSHV